MPENSNAQNRWKDSIVVTGVGLGRPLLGVRILYVLFAIWSQYFSPHPGTEPV